jgi:WD40 repeat protein
MKTKTRRVLFWAIIALGFVLPWVAILGFSLPFDVPLAEALRPLKAVLPLFPVSVVLIAAWWTLPFVAFAFLWHRLATAGWEPLRRNWMLILLGIPVAMSPMGAAESSLSAVYLLLFLAYTMVAIPSWGLGSSTGRVILSLFGFGALLLFTLFGYGQLRAVGVERLSTHIEAPMGILAYMTIALFIGYLLAKPIDLLVCHGKLPPDISDRPKPSAWLIGGNALACGLGFIGIMLLYSTLIGDVVARHEIGQFLADQTIRLTLSVMAVGVTIGLFLYLASFAMLHKGRYRADRPFLIIVLATLPGLLTGIGPGLLGERAVFAVMDSNYLVQYLLYPSEPIDKIAISPDGTRIAAGRPERLVVWDIASGDLVLDARSRQPPTPTTPVLLTSGDVLAWSRDGSMVSVGAADGRIAILDSHTGYRLHSLALPKVREWGGNATGALFSRDGKRFFATEYQGSIYVYELTGGNLEQTWQSPVPTRDLLAIALSPQGDQLAVAGISASEANPMGGFVAILDSTSGETLYVMDDFEQAVSQLSFSPDGSLLLLAGTDNPPRLIDASTGLPLLELRHHCPPPSKPYGSSFFDAAFLGGRSVAVACSGGMTQVCDASHGDCRVLFELQLSTVDGVATHPNGRHVAFLENRRSITLWDVQAAEPRLSFRLP